MSGDIVSASLLPRGVKQTKLLRRSSADLATVTIPAFSRS
jgi:hypothetical protein